MAWLAFDEDQSLSSGIGRAGRQRSALDCSGGPKGPPSAPPTIPPIIITPYKYQTPEPAIDPRITPPGPPVRPPGQPAIYFC
ncbi:hypothetical protein FHS03_003396 [Massilia violacea]|uniref:Uncharacterized protein n=1 Tax=Pseudoduganella violacea TaxID=1715466 RepID=A0A7W5BBX5_9BURK|nr:hypothetical protein [Pseudoduganella violacea]